MPAAPRISMHIFTPNQIPKILEKNIVLAQYLGQQHITPPNKEA